MKIILLTGQFENPSGTNFSLEKIGSQLWIDHQIESLLKLKYEVDIVLGADHSDEIMRASQLVKMCNIIFDPNEALGNPLSNLHAGLHATYQETFLLPVQFKCPEEHVWKKLINLLVPIETQGFHILRPYCPVNGIMEPGYPLGITRTAKNIILKNRKLKSLIEYNFKEYKIPFLDKALTQPHLNQFNEI